MKNIAIRLEEKNGTVRINEPVSLGIPLLKGAVQATHELSIIDGEESVSAQFAPLSRWPDGSLRWVHASFLANLNAGHKKDLMLAKLPTPASSRAELAVTQTIDGLVVQTSAGQVVLSPAKLSWHLTRQSNAGIPSSVTLSDQSGRLCTAIAETSWKITRQGPVFVTATLKGQWRTQDNEPLAKFQCDLQIFLETSLVQMELTTHNPQRASHSGGLWDLGDPGSIYFRELAVETALPVRNLTKVTLQATDKAAETIQLDEFNLYQDSSGGENWQSNNHINGEGEVSTQFCGFKLSGPGDVLQEGKRADPVISIEQDGSNLNIAVPGFWQNFPTSLRKEETTLVVGLFPKDSKSAYELQGGEQKTLRLLMAYDSNNSISGTAYEPLVPVLAPENYEQAEAFPWFNANAQSSALDELIAKGLNGSSNFFSKREVIDEFGWRNFGDIFADHETLYQSADQAPFISHYNNQYDPIYGFARQFALTGDQRWFQLMDDLARHVTDIDIYHTEEDRSEYNNGLFWHTDHYLGAKTATHRTFSRLNNSSSTPGQTGGGPADEHCYSTGLVYHYQLTGNEKSKQAVLGLARWMTVSHEGQDGFLAQVLALKKREIPALKKMIRGEKVSTHRYPFTRGTGNYLNTLLDAWIIDENESWLKNAEDVIRKTIHPADVIEHRNLMNVEICWSYLILLTSLFRYLQLKRQLDSEDDQYEYTKASLLRYTHWMLDNEQSFLADKSQLEFPNDTWVAQDIRKAMLMFQAAELDHENSVRYRQQGQQWLHEVTETLENSRESQLTRIIVILMQNYGPQSSTSSLPSVDKPASFSPRDCAPPVMTWSMLISRIGVRLMRALLTFRPLRERVWLTTRLNRS